MKSKSRSSLQYLDDRGCWTFHSFLKILIFCGLHIMHSRKPPHQNKIKSKRKRKREEERENLRVDLHHDLLSLTLYPLFQSSSLPSVHCQKSLIWLEASSFCYTIDNWLSVALTINILLLVCVMEILLFWMCRLFPFTLSNGSYMNWMSGSGW